nr:type 1 glutamine amidotransferase domain-containing protein [Metabacillus kandeliae]
MVVTTADKMNNGDSTGLWLSEFGEAYIEFKKAGYDITVASPLGGKAPVDDRSLAEEKNEEILSSASLLEETIKMDTLNSSDFDAIFLPGGHGTMFDLPDNLKLQELIKELFEAGKPVAAVCHGPAGLTGAYLTDGTPLVKGKRVTGFTNEEEKATGLDIHMPFLLETKLREMGAKFEDSPEWSEHVVVDGNLMTGQNPQSTSAAAKAMIELLG